MINGLILRLIFLLDTKFFAVSPVFSWRNLFLLLCPFYSCIFTWCSWVKCWRSEWVVDIKRRSSGLRRKEGLHLKLKRNIKARISMKRSGRFQMHDASLSMKRRNHLPAIVLPSLKIHLNWLLHWPWPSHHPQDYHWRNSRA